jgi:hypothetical protein
LKIETYIFVFSGKLGKEVVVEINTGAEILRAKGKRKLRINFSLYLENIRLEYWESDLAFLSLLKILLTRSTSDFFLFRDKFLAFMMFRYEIRVPLKVNAHYAPEILTINDGIKQTIWVSRKAQKIGIFSALRDQENEWNIFRHASSLQGYLLDVRVLDNNLRGKQSISPLPHPAIQPLVVRKVKELAIPSDNELRVLHLEDMKINRLAFAEKQGTVYPVHKFSFFENTGRPTSLIFRENNSLCFYEIDYSSWRSVDSLVMIPFSINWYHFLVEGLAPLLTRLKNISPAPVLVDYRCPKNIIELLELATGYKPEILGIHQTVLSKQVDIIQDWRFKERFVFSERSDDLGLIREFLNSFDNKHEEGLSSGIQSMRAEIVFLRRPPGLFRQIHNIEDALRYLSNKGILVVEPSSIEFRSLARILNQARIVIVETGAAVTNLLVCNAETVVIEIQPTNLDHHFWSSFFLELKLQHIPIEAPLSMFNRFTYCFPIRQLDNILNELA